MAAQGDAHIVDLQRDRIAAEQALVQQLDASALDEAQFEQASLQFNRVLVVVTVIVPFMPPGARPPWIEQ